MQTAATTTETPEGFSDAEWQKFERFQAAKEAQRIKTEREKARLTTRAILHRNETGSPLSLPRGCTLKDDLLAKELRCDGTDPADRLAGQKPAAAPGEPFWVPKGHHDRPGPALPELDPASVADEPTLQDRLLLGELRSVKQGAEGPATQADRILKDLVAQRQILDDRIAQQRVELARRQSHVEGAEAKIQEFLSSHSEPWRAALLGGAAEASLEGIKLAADEAERRRPECHTVDDIRRATADRPGHGVGICVPRLAVPD